MTYMRGFGQLPFVKAGGGAYVPPTTSTGPSFYVEPTGPIGYTSFGISTIWIRYLEKLGLRIQQTITGIRETGWITQQVPNSRSLLTCGLGFKSYWQDILFPPGIINVYGIPFTIDELQTQGKLQRSFVPTAEQKFLIDYAVYLKSQAMLAGQFNGKGCGKNVDIAMDHKFGANNERNPTRLLNFDGQNGSVSQWLRSCDDVEVAWDPARKVPAWTTYIDGFSFNPIQPTDEELNTSGGLRRYYERGGFLLNNAVVNAKVKLDAVGQYGLRWGVGYYVCPTPNPPIPSQNKNYPADGSAGFADGGVPALALKAHTGDGDGWNIWLVLAPDHYTVGLTPTDPGAMQKILGGIASIAEELYKMFCTVLPAAAPLVNQQLLAEICTDASGKTCKKGTPGCNCTPPSTSQKDAVGAATAIANYVCAQAAPTTPTEVPPPQQLVPPPDDKQDVGTWRPPWWAIVLGGLGVGAIAFSAKR